MNVVRILVCAALVGPWLPAAAQIKVTWEKVGDLALDTYVAYSIGPDGFFWAARDEVKDVNGQQVFFQGLYRLSAPYKATNPWEKVSEPVLTASTWAHVVGRDTILLNEGNKTYRSDDGAASWARVQDADKVQQIFEIPAGLPYQGRLVAAARSELASFSDDRGATWTKATIFSQYAQVDRIAVVTAAPHAGRLLGAGISGITASDDGGATWQITSEWEALQQSTSCIGILRGQGSDGGDRVVTVINDISIPDDSVRVSLSDDGGDTWQRGQGLFPGSFRTCVEVVDLGSGRAVALMKRGPVWWTQDAGESWSRWAEWIDLLAPEDSDAVNPLAVWAFVGPDGHLYIGLATGGGDQAVHDKRTSEPVAAWAVATEEDPATDPGVLQVAPNPSRGTVTLSVRGAPALRREIAVFDVAGRKIARHEIAGGSSWSIDVSAWAPGQYRARVTGNGASVRPVSFTVVR